MPENYDAPTMVAFYEIYNKEDVLYGIAFEGKIICACCGSIFLSDEVSIIEEYPWTNFREIFEKTP